MAHKIIRKVEGLGDMQAKKDLLKQSVQNDEYVKQQGGIRLTTTLVVISENGKTFQLQK